MFMQNLATNIFGHADSNRSAIILYNYFDEHKLCIQIIFDPVRTGENNKTKIQKKSIARGSKKKN